MRKKARLTKKREAVPGSRIRNQVSKFAQLEATSRIRGGGTKPITAETGERKKLTRFARVG
jgi:hypothetical protein